MALATFFIFTSVFSLFYVAALALIIIPEDLFAPSQQEFPPQISKTTQKTRSQTANESSTTTNESLSSDDSLSNDTLSPLVKKSPDLSHLQKNLLTKSRTRERQTKST